MTAREIEMVATADDGIGLAGTLTVPEGPGPHPAIVMIPGSGRLDRESNIGRVHLNLGRPLAAALAAHGIASYRYDRRGVAATPGDWRAAGLIDNLNDAKAAVRALAARAEIKADAIGVVGHSEGAYHAMRLAADGDVAAAVLLAGFARSGEDALMWQMRGLADRLPAFTRPLRPAGKWWVARRIARIKATTTDVARINGRRTNARWFRELLAANPCDQLPQITVPVLAITGEKDIQVDPDDLDVIARLVGGPIETRRIPDLTHLLRRDPGKPAVRFYPRQLRKPIEPDLLDDVAAWLATRLV